MYSFRGFIDRISTVNCIIHRRHLTVLAHKLYAYDRVKTVRLNGVHTMFIVHGRR